MNLHIDQKSHLNIVVTGGAGFIGSALIRHLINHTNHFVLNIDKLTYAGNLKSLDSIKNSHRYFFEKIDICNRKGLKQIFDRFKPDIVMHLAAESHVDRSIDEPSAFIKTNIIGTYTLLELSRNYWENLKGNRKASFRFHHISTDEVYGDLPHPDNQIKPLIFFTETSPYNPSSPYSASKASSDHLVRAWYKTFGLPILISNCSNNYGPYHYPEKLIPLIILNALKGKILPVYGNGNQIRDWLYVEDHVKALMLIATKGEIGSTYNVGGNNEKRNIEVVKIICSILEELSPIKYSELDISSYESLITYVKDRPGHDLRYAINAEKIQKELGWKPEESFESGIFKTTKWYLENLQWCKTISNYS